jgi:hypothetical protein
MITIYYRIVVLGIIVILLLGDVLLATDLKAHDEDNSSGADVGVDGYGVYKVRSFRVASANS